jgi:uridylate kinase
MRFSRAKKKREYIVVSVGGSLIVPDGIDTAFLERLHSSILAHVKRGLSFYIVAGGGMTARSYQKAVEEVRGDLHAEDVDWLGIHSTRLNAHLLRALFKEEAQERIVKNPTRGIRGNASVIIGAGWRPGASTDYCAVLAAKQLGAKRLVNLSNIDYVYTNDPRHDPNATPIERTTWAEFRKIIPDAWDPGLSSPFDPVASKLAHELKMEVAIINGKKIEEFDKYISGQPFTGTVIAG